METKVDTELVGVSANIRRIRELIDHVAQTGFNVIVCGETGVGKELVVSQLVQKSNRIGKPYVKVNCAALPDTLLESEMFGYERGAFTGAIRTRRGKFEQAHGGVLFLDEIGDMSLPLQSKLLHVLQGGDFSPLGSEKQVQTDVWVIAATNRNLAADVERGNFRDDLYYRLSTITITIEPLRRRPEDIPLLLDYYIRKFSTERGRKQDTVLSEAALARLCAYPWPGNVRELQNVLQRIIVLGEGEEALEGMLISASPRQSPEAEPGTPAASRSSALVEALADSSGKGGAPDLSLKKIRRQAVNQVERELISHVLIRTGWNRSKASRILKVSYKTLLQKIEELQIQPPPELA
jgi:transcriptional regulator with GAF, ATPase, and Fis domain